MLKMKDVCHDNPKYNDYIDIEKLTGLKVTSILCGVSLQFGEPMIELYGLVFENGERVFINGEHDIAYLEGTEDLPNMDNDVLESLYNEVNGD